MCLKLATVSTVDVDGRRESLARAVWVNVVPLLAQLLGIYMRYNIYVSIERNPRVYPPWLPSVYEREIPGTSQPRFPILPLLLHLRI